MYNFYKQEDLHLHFIMYWDIYWIYYHFVFNNGT